MIGFIGQGFIGKNYANDFEARGHKIVRYSLEPEYVSNKERIKECDIVFIAVSANTTPKGFDDSNIREALNLVGKHKTAVIKSTIPPRLTKQLQADYPYIYILHSPEFLTEVTAEYDARHPCQNIIGLPVYTEEYRLKAQAVIKVLPKAPTTICRSEVSELYKYLSNVIPYTRVIMINMFYDMAQTLNVDWELIKSMASLERTIGPHYLDAVHKSGRGAGGHCFIKDFQTFKDFYLPSDLAGHDVLNALIYKNKKLLLESNKDLDLLEIVYGK